MENYKLIQAAKDRAVERVGDTHEFKPEDVVAKIEYEDGSEKYVDGFKDYHGS